MTDLVERLCYCPDGICENFADGSCRARYYVMPDYPHVRAAFINAIAEEGTKAEAIEWLQKLWNENCALRDAYASLQQDDDQHRAEIDRLRARLNQAVHSPPDEVS